MPPTVEPLLGLDSLRGLIAMCLYCKRVRTDAQTWRALERHLTEHVEVPVSHGICPECFGERFGHDEP